MVTQLGDMTVGADLRALPVQMVRALAAISLELHPAYDAATGMQASSKDKCLFASLAVRDFLVQIGFDDATVRGCAFYATAEGLDGASIWSVGIGFPSQKPEPEDKLFGHAVTTVPSLRLMIDTTLYQAIRPHFCGAITGMAATGYQEPRERDGILAQAHCTLPDRNVWLTWYDRPELPWRKSQDFRVRNARRIAVTKALVETYRQQKAPHPVEPDAG